MNTFNMIFLAETDNAFLFRHSKMRMNIPLVKTNTVNNVGALTPSTEYSITYEQEQEQFTIDATS